MPPMFQRMQPPNAPDPFVEDAARFRALLDLTRDWYWEQDAEFRFTSVIRPRSESQFWERAILGKRRWELPFENMTPARWQEHRACVEAHRPFRDLELCRRTDAGEKIWFSVSGAPMFDERGGFIGYHGVGRNITDRRLAQERLRSSERRFKGFMDNAPAVAWMKDADLRYTYLSAAFERMVGRPAADLLGKHDLEVGWPQEAARTVREYDLEVLRSGNARAFLQSAMHSDGTVHHWYDYKFPFPDETGAPGLAGMSLDITERVNAEEKVRQYSDEVRALCTTLVNTQESERRRVADDLHDLIGQNLTALGLDLAAMTVSLQERNAQAEVERLRSMKVLLDETVEAIRGVMAELKPPGLEELGLVAALHWYASVFTRRSGIKVSLNASDGVRFPHEIEVAVFRIVQEALTNVAKHSRGKSADIVLAPDSGRLRLTISDDGTGFVDPVGARSARRGGWGLPSMRERVEALGGALRVDFPGSGTRLSVELPVQP